MEQAGPPAHPPKKSGAPLEARSLLSSLAPVQVDAGPRRECRKTGQEARVESLPQCPQRWAPGGRRHVERRGAVVWIHSTVSIRK